MIVKMMEEANEEGERGAGELQSWNKQATNLMLVSSREHSDLKARAKLQNSRVGGGASCEGIGGKRTRDKCL